MSITLWFQTIVGIFCLFAFLIITYYLKKNQLSIGPWVLLGFASICLTVSEYVLIVNGNLKLHSYLFTVAMIMVFIVALLKFWDIMELVQGY